jgi:hypothetical protein
LQFLKFFAFGCTCYYLESDIKQRQSRGEAKMFSSKMSFSSKQQSFLMGAGSILDLAGQSFGNLSIGDESTDKRALQSDWNAVGKDIRRAYNAEIGNRHHILR